MPASRNDDFLRPINRLRRKDHRIGLVGYSRSGKSVLLTALLDHLRLQDPQRFPLSKRSLFPGHRPSGQGEIIQFSQSQSAFSLPTFPYESYRRSLIQDAHWPEKTGSAFSYACEYNWKGGFLGSNIPEKLDFMDLPGERLADLSMGALDFVQWSEAFFQNLHSYPVEPAIGKWFEEVTSKGDLKEADILRNYKIFLGHLIWDYRPGISPSTFLLDLSGGYLPADKEPEWYAENRFVGLSEDQQFCPLNEFQRSSHPTLLHRFEERYKDYRNEVVGGLFKSLKKCDRLVFLFNIPEMLQSGVGALQDNQILLQNLVNFCLPGKNIGARVDDWLRNKLFSRVLPEQWRPGGIEKIAFVATQSDRVHPSDVDQLRSLLNDLTYQTIKNYSHRLQFEHFVCAAVKSTGADDDFLVGRRETKAEAASSQPVSYKVSRLPALWPDDWKDGDFSFPSVQPAFSRNHQRPPESIGLNGLFEFLVRR